MYNIVKTTLIANTITAVIVLFLMGHTAKAQELDFAGELQITNAPNGVAFSTNGKKMFTVGIGSDAVTEYKCRRRFQVATCRFKTRVGNPFDVSRHDTSPWDVDFSSNGLRMFVTGKDTNTIYAFSLRKAFNVSTAVFIESMSVAEIMSVAEGVSVDDDDLAVRSLAFSDNGHKMFVIGNKKHTIFEFILPYAFRFHGAFFNDSKDLSSQIDTTTGLAFSPGGYNVFVSDNNDDTVTRFNLGTAFDVSTIDTQEVFSQTITEAEESPLGLARVVTNNGCHKLFVASVKASSVLEYNIPIANGGSC